MIFDKEDLKLILLLIKQYNGYYLDCDDEVLINAIKIKIQRLLETKEVEE